jgi:hypothetical protein
MAPLQQHLEHGKMLGEHASGHFQRDHKTPNLQRHDSNKQTHSSLRIFSVKKFTFSRQSLLIILPFSRAVLEMQWSDGLHEMGYPKWQLVLCLMLVYVMLYISLFKGVKSSGTGHFHHKRDNIS